MTLSGIFLEMREVSPRFIYGWFCLTAALLGGCGQEPAAPSSSQAAPAAPQFIRPAGVPLYTYEIVNVYPHDSNAFTEGLVYYQGELFESTGLYGRSTLRRVELKTGRVLQETNLAPRYFGEGLTLLNGKAYQLTYREETGFVYQLDTFQSGLQFSYSGEGWGLTTDGQSLIMDDGSENIRYINPGTFKETRRIRVLADGQPVTNLNELEWVKGELYANVWRTSEMLRVNPQDGKIVGVVDFSGLLRIDEQEHAEVLNGIAYDPEGDRLFVTGKLWPKLFEVRLRPKQ